MAALRSAPRRGFSQTLAPTDFAGSSLLLETTLGSIRNDFDCQRWDRKTGIRLRNLRIPGIMHQRKKTSPKMKVDKDREAETASRGTSK